MSIACFDVLKGAIKCSPVEAVAKNADSLWALLAEALLSSGWKVLVAVLPALQKHCEKMVRCLCRPCLTFAHYTLPLPTIPHLFTRCVASAYHTLPLLPLHPTFFGAG